MLPSTLLRKIMIASSRCLSVCISVELDPKLMSIEPFFDTLIGTVTVWLIVVTVPVEYAFSKLCMSIRACIGGSKWLLCSAEIRSEYVTVLHDDPRRINVRK